MFHLKLHFFPIICIRVLQVGEVGYFVHNSRLLKNVQSAFHINTVLRALLGLPHIVHFKMECQPVQNKRMKRLHYTVRENKAAAIEST